MPTQFFSIIRTKIIPTIWNETGIEIFGNLNDFDYRLQIVNGLESNGFSSENWIVRGHQANFETIKAAILYHGGKAEKIKTNLKTLTKRKEIGYYNL